MTTTESTSPRADNTLGGWVGVDPKASTLCGADSPEICSSVNGSVSDILVSVVWDSFAMTAATRQYDKHRYDNTATDNDRSDPRNRSHCALGCVGDERVWTRLCYVWLILGEVNKDDCVYKGSDAWTDCSALARRVKPLGHRDKVTRHCHLRLVYGLDFKM